MKKNRVLASIILTAGLGLSGVTAATASDAASSAPDHAKSKKVVCVMVHKDKNGKEERTTVKIIDGKYYVNGKQVPKSKVPAKCTELPPLPGGKGKHICVIAHRDGKAVPVPGGPEKNDVKAVDGKIYLNGKQISKDKLPGKCAVLPPLPGGKGKHICVIVGKDGRAVPAPGTAQPGNIKIIDGKGHFSAKPVSKGKLPGKCPAKPPASGKGKDSEKGTSKSGSATGGSHEAGTTAAGHPAGSASTASTAGAVRG